MSISAYFHPRSSTTRRAGLSPARRRGSIWPLATLALFGLLAYGSEQAGLALQSSGRIIRGDLESAASEARILYFTATPAEVQQAITPYFRGFNTTVDARSFPASVSVTLHGLDRNSCLDASAVARRLEGRVVVNLLGYRSAADCGERNDMTWRIMP
jgi:hypothetical protein